MHYPYRAGLLVLLAAAAGAQAQTSSGDVFAYKLTFPRATSKFACQQGVGFANLVRRTVVAYMNTAPFTATVNSRTCG